MQIEVEGSAVTLPTLVSNLGQSNNATRAMSLSPSVGFTTGSAPEGYEMTAAKLDFFSGTSKLGNVFVELWSADGSAPDELITALTKPDNLSSSGIKTFSAPADTTLAADTTYFIVARFNDVSGAPHVQVTNSDAEDSASLTGWSIADSGYTYQTGSWQADNVSVKVAVEGSTAPAIATPGAPTGVGATPGDGQVTLAWTAPDSIGGGDITGYEYEQDGSGSWTSTGATATSHTVTGLTNGQAYTFRVRAVNSVGPGEASAASASVTPVEGLLWVGTMTVGASHSGTPYKGYNFTSSPLVGGMTCNVITHGTKKYALVEILVYDSSKNLWVFFSEGILSAEPECGVSPSAVLPADEADNLIIQLGASEFPLAAADVSTNTRYTFNSSGLNWSVGDSVVVKLIHRAPPAPPVETPFGSPQACSETPDASDTTAPSLNGAQIDGATVTLEFDEAICGGAGSALLNTHFQATVNGSAWRVNKIAYAGSTVTLTLQRAVTASDKVSIKYSPDSFITGVNPTPLDDIEKLNDLNHNLVTTFRRRTANDSLNNVTPATPAELPYGFPQACSVTPDASDTTAPSVTGAQVDGATVTLEFDEAICGGAGSALLNTHFQATVNGSAWRVNKIAYAGSTVTLTLQRAVKAGDAISINYSPDSFISGNPTPLDDIEKLNDLNHNLVAAFRRGTADDSLVNVTSGTVTPPPGGGGGNVGGGGGGTGGGGGGGGGGPAAVVEIGGASYAAAGSEVVFAVAVSDGTSIGALGWTVTGPGGFTATTSAELLAFVAPTGGAYTVSVTVDDVRRRTLTARVTLTVLGDIAGHQFLDEIVWLAEQGITRGCAAHAYCPNDPVTRAQMASLLARALALQAPRQQAGLADVDPSSVHAADIEALFAAQITAGCTQQPLQYCPDRPVTRAQMAALLARALALQAPRQQAGFADVDPSSVHAADIEALFAAQITAGCTQQPLQYCPDRPVTRALMAAFLYRARDRISTVS